MIGQKQKTEYLNTYLRIKHIIILLLLTIPIIGQKTLDAEMLESHTFRFSLDANNNFNEATQVKWLELIDGHQFIGLAEVHNSRQLSYFTTAFLRTLSKLNFKYFALELGPNSIEILNELCLNSNRIGEEIRIKNRKYGKRNVSKTPLIFVNKKTDVVFLERAVDLDFEFWGLDQEYAYSYEMLFDHIYTNIENPNTALQKLYEDSKNLLQKNIYKNRKEGQPIYCWYISEITLNRFLDTAKSINPNTEKIVEDIRKSWDIYCKSASGLGSNQQRADYMKSNFHSYYSKSEKDAKVFFKLGGAHLTHGISPFGVDDIGKELEEIAHKNNSGFLSIHHLIAYRNGKNNIKKKGWKSLKLFLQLGKKEEWTVIDLRPIREKIKAGLITTSEKSAYEIMNYDLILISQNDQYDKPNY